MTDTFFDIVIFVLRGNEESIRRLRQDLTHTLDPIAQPALTTGAVEGPGCVDTGGVDVAVMGVHLTLVHICTRGEMDYNFVDGQFLVNHVDYLRLLRKSLQWKRIHLNEIGCLKVLNE